MTNNINNGSSVFSVPVSQTCEPLCTGNWLDVNDLSKCLFSGILVKIRPKENTEYTTVYFIL